MKRESVGVRTVSPLTGKAYIRTYGGRTVSPFTVKAYIRTYGGYVRTDKEESEMPNEEQLVALTESLGCDRNLLYEIQKEVFGDRAESGMLSDCRRYALTKLGETAPHMDWNRTNERAERFSSNWGKFRYEVRRSEKERSYALYGVLLDVVTWNGMNDYWMDECRKLATRLNDMAQNTPDIKFVCEDSGTEETFEDANDALNRFEELLDQCSEIRVSFRFVKEWRA